MTRERAYQLRAMIVKASASLPDADALEAVELFDEWKPDTEFAKDIRVRYNGKLYRVVQDHTSQAGWEPPNVPALFTEVAKPGEIPTWKQPTGVQDVYQTGDKVHYPTAEDQIWISTADNNVWQPGVYGWEIYKEN